MRAVRVQEFTGPAGLRMAEVPMPQPETNRLLVDVRASGVCFADLLTSRGRYQRTLTAPYLLGCELAGVVVEAPPSSIFVVGDRVLAIGQSGGFAEYCAVDPAWTVRIPDALTFAEACALPNYQTVDFALTQRCYGLRPDRVLVLGASGGLGGAAVDVLAGQGIEVVAATRRPDRAGFTALGARNVIDIADPAALATCDPFDLVIDPVGGDSCDRALASLQPGGLYLTVGFASGTVPAVRLNKLLLRNVAVSGAAWGEYLARNPSALAAVHAQTVARVAAGWRPPGATIYQGLEHTPKAFQQMDDGLHVGKQVILQ